VEELCVDQGEHIRMIELPADSNFPLCVLDLFGRRTVDLLYDKPLLGLLAVTLIT
jgi:hypothetical protein